MQSYGFLSEIKYSTTMHKMYPDGDENKLFILLGLMGIIISVIAEYT